MTASDEALALIYAAPQQAVLRHVAIRPSERQINADGDVIVRTLWSGLSRGTERLVFRGEVPASEYARMRAPHQEGQFPFQVKYGYAAVGIVEDGPAELHGKTVFALHPHQTKFALKRSELIPVPEDIPPKRAILAANLETALNVLWDAEAGPEHRISVVGGGVLGLMIAALAGRSPADVSVIDIDDSRAPLARVMGATFHEPASAPKDQDIVIHTSASEAGLRLALGLARFEGPVIEASWFGNREVALPLGGAFHSQRLRLISSQVGAVAPSHRAGITSRQRLEMALDVLRDPLFDQLITEEVAFTDLPDALPRLLSPGAPGLATAIRYHRSQD